MTVADKKTHNAKLITDNLLLSILEASDGSSKCSLLSCSLSRARHARSL